MKKLDQTGDTNFRELHQYVRLYDFPDFAKKAQLADIIEPETKTARIFADVRTPHQFPCHNKAAAYVSYIYFLEKQSEINPKVRDRIRGRLDKFAEYWGINNILEKATTKHASFQAENVGALPDSSFAFVWVGDDGHGNTTQTRRYPMRNDLEVKAAASWFNQYLPEIREQYGFLDRQTVANKILDKAAQMHVELPRYEDTLEKAAGRGWCDPAAAANLIRNRIKVGHRVDQPVAAALEKLADSVEHTPSMFMDPASTANLAETVDQFDRTYHVLNKYSESVPAPEDVFFRATYKEAGEMVKDACTTTTGSVYSTQDFAKISTSDIRNLFGDEMAQEVTTGLKVDPEKLATIVATLPRPDAQLFDRLLTDNGINPIAKEASDTKIGYDHKQLKQLAALIE
jgi:hypothetical protein